MAMAVQAPFSISTVVTRLERYRGQKVSVISNNEYRYEGWLTEPGTEQNPTISMSKVRFCGTESRRCREPVVPREEVYDHVKIRVGELKEIFAHVERCPEMSVDTAVVECTPAVVPILWAAMSVFGDSQFVLHPKLPMETARSELFTDADFAINVPSAVKLLSDHLASESKNKVNFISRSYIRYEGTLSALVPESQTVSLSNVKFLGTEDRTVQKKVAARAETYPNVKFQLKEIRCIRVFVDMCDEMFEDTAVLPQESSLGVIELNATPPPSMAIDTTPHSSAIKTHQSAGTAKQLSRSSSNSTNSQEHNAASHKLAQVANNAVAQQKEATSSRTSAAKGSRKSAPHAETRNPSARSGRSAGGRGGHRSEEKQSETSTSESTANSHADKPMVGSQDSVEPERMVSDDDNDAKVNGELPQTVDSNKRPATDTAENTHKRSKPRWSSKRKSYNPRVRSTALAGNQIPISPSASGSGVESSDNKPDDEQVKSEQHNGGPEDSKPEIVPVERPVLNVVWTHRKSRCPLEDCSENYVGHTMYVMQQHFTKNHAATHPNVHLILKCPMCDTTGFDGKIPNLAVHLEADHHIVNWDFSAKTQEKETPKEEEGATNVPTAEPEVREEVGESVELTNPPQESFQEIPEPETDVPMEIQAAPGPAVPDEPLEATEDHRLQT